MENSKLLHDYIYYEEKNLKTKLTRNYVDIICSLFYEGLFRRTVNRFIYSSLGIPYGALFLGSVDRGKSWKVKNA